MQGETTIYFVVWSALYSSFARFVSGMHEYGGFNYGGHMELGRPRPPENRPFPNCFEPQHESQGECKTFHMIINFVCISHLASLS